MTEDPPAPAKMVPVPRPPLGVNHLQTETVWQWQYSHNVCEQLCCSLTWSQWQGCRHPCTCAHDCWLEETCNHIGFIIKMSSSLDILTFCFFLLNLSQLRASGQGRLKFCRIWRQARFTLWQSGRQGPACVLSHIRRWVMEKESKVYVSCNHFFTDWLMCKVMEKDSKVFFAE